MKALIQTKLLPFILAGSLLGLLPQAALASHKENVNYDWLVATGDLCSLPEPNPCPAVSIGDNDDRIEIAGSGTLSTNPKIATGGGSFVHKDKDGNVIGTGTWTATGLRTFRSYGTQEGFPENFEGGKARILVHFVSSDGSVAFDGVLKIFCTIGDFPANAHEGVELRLKGGGPDFTEIVSGLTLFIKK